MCHLQVRWARRQLPNTNGCEVLGPNQLVPGPGPLLVSAHSGPLTLVEGIDHIKHVSSNVSEMGKLGWDWPEVSSQSLV